MAALAMSDPSPRYRVMKSLGKGGMGQVFLAEDTLLQRSVALKFLGDPLQHDAPARERFQREARSAAALDHPFICKIHDITDLDGRTCIVMEYVEGETLLARLTRAQLAAKEALRIAEEIAEALQEAHRRRIVHRDLKPSNVMLTHQGHVKVMDFGLAKQLPAATMHASEAETVTRGPTELGVRVGTPAYMSPEQLLGLPLDERSDIFAFGIVLYELLTGIHPFHRKSQSATLAAILREPPAPVTQHLTDAPDSFDVTLGKLLAKEPADRYQTFPEICGDLRRLREQLSGRHAFDQSGAPTPAPATVTRTPYVGREAERAELRRLLDQAAGGQGTLVLIGGEPGVGKTRLVEETLGEARRGGFLALTGRCYETAGTPPFIPFVEIVEHAARVVPSSAFREILGDAAPEVAKLVPELRRMFPDIPPPLELPPEQQRRYLFNSVLEFVERGCRVTPHAALLDDLHWADEPTLLLLQHLAQRLPQIPMLVLGTYRDVELDVDRPFADMLETLTRQRLAQRLVLRRLPEDNVRAMLATLGGQAPPDQLVHAVYQETEGNPFFVEEVFHHLAEEGKLFDAAGRWRADLRIDELDVPEGVKLVIGRRLKRLGEETRRGLTAAALVGRSFDLALLEAISKERGDPLLRALEEAEAAHVIRSEGGREAKWIFAHELIRQTLVSQLSLPRRQRVHLQIAEAIEQVYRSALDKRAGDLAHHLYQAGAAADPEKTVRYLTRAGDQALAASAFEEALRNYEVALSLGDRMPERERADLLVKRGQGLRSLGRPADAIPHWQEALSIYEGLGDVEATARLCCDIGYQLLIWLHRWRDAADICTRGLQAVGDQRSADRWRLLATTGLAVGITGDYEAGAAMLQEAREVAERLGDRRLLGQVLSNRVNLDAGYGEFGQVVDVGQRAAGELRGVGDLWELAGVLGFVEVSLAFLGRLDDVAMCDRELRPLAVRVGHHGALMVVEFVHAHSELMRTGDLDAWETFARRSPEAWQRAGPFTWLGYTFTGMGQFWKGQWQEAPASFECVIRSGPLPDWYNLPWGWLFLVKAYAAHADALQVFATKRAALPSPGKPGFNGAWHLAELAVEALAVLGQRREAHSLYPTLLRLMEMRLTGWGVGLVATSAGIAAACGGDWDRAEQHYQTALRQAHEIPHKIAQPEVRRWYAQMLLDRNGPGDRDRARTLLKEAIEMYRTIGMPKHLEIAQRMWRRV